MFRLVSRQCLSWTHRPHHRSDLSSGQRSKNVGHGSKGLGSMTDAVLFFSRQLSQRTTEFRDEEHRVVTESLRTNKPFSNNAAEGSHGHSKVSPRHNQGGDCYKSGSPSSRRHTIQFLEQPPTVVFVGCAFTR